MRPSALIGLLCLLAASVMQDGILPLNRSPSDAPISGFANAATVQVDFQVSFLLFFGGQEVLFIPPVNQSRRWQMMVFPVVDDSADFTAPVDGSGELHSFAYRVSAVSFQLPVDGSANSTYQVLVVDPDDENTNPVEYGSGTPLYNGRVNVSNTATGSRSVIVNVQFAPVGVVVRFLYDASRPGLVSQSYDDGVLVSMASVPTALSQRASMWDEGNSSAGGIVFAVSPSSFYRVSFTLPTLPRPTELHLPAVIPTTGLTFNASKIVWLQVDLTQTVLCSGSAVNLTAPSGSFPAVAAPQDIIVTPYLACTWVLRLGTPKVWLRLNYSLLQPNDEVIVVLDSRYGSRFRAVANMANTFEATFSAGSVTILYSAGGQAGIGTGCAFEWQAIPSEPTISSQMLVIIVAFCTTAGVLLLFLIIWFCFVLPSIRRSRARLAADRARLMDGGIIAPNNGPGNARVKHHVSKRILRLLPVQAYQLPANRQAGELNAPAFADKAVAAAAVLPVASAAEDGGSPTAAGTDRVSASRASRSLRLNGTAASASGRLNASGRRNGSGRLSPELEAGTPADAAAEGELSPDEIDCCSICLVEFEVGEKVKLLPCRHFFHITCIDQWLRRDVVCPLCKRNVLDAFDMEQLARDNDAQRADSDNNVERPDVGTLSAAGAANIGGDAVAGQQTRGPAAAERSVVPTPSAGAAALPPPGPESNNGGAGMAHFFRRISDVMTGASSSALVAPAMRSSSDPPAPVPVRIQVPPDHTAAPAEQHGTATPPSAAAAPPPSPPQAVSIAASARGGGTGSLGTAAAPASPLRTQSSFVPHVVASESPPLSPDPSRRSAGAVRPTSSRVELSYVGSSQGLGHASGSASSNAVPGVVAGGAGGFPRGSASGTSVRSLSPTAHASPRLQPTLSQQRL